jgi:nucleotide-binding universal stress UspA family protein
MQTNQPIVVGTDGSETAERAVDRAGVIARALGATVHVVGGYSRYPAPAVDPDSERTRAEQSVDRAQQRLTNLGIESEAHLAPGEPGRALVEIAEEQGAQMIVVGNRGMTGARRVLGSVPNHVSHHARCDVLIVSTT